MATIYDKTSAGRQSLSTRQPELSRSLRTLMLLVDGRKSDEDLLGMLCSREIDTSSFATLVRLGLIAPRDEPAPRRPEPADAQTAPALQPAPAAPQPRTSAWARLSQGLRSVMQSREESPRERSAGLAEVVRCAAVGDARFFAWLQEHVDALRAQDAKAIAHVVQHVPALRESIEAQDRLQRRAVSHLDFGWTLGKVIESVLGYGHYLHGEAVGLGMVLAADIGLGLGMQSETSAQHLKTLLQHCGLPMAPPRVSATRWLELLPVDRDGAAGQVQFVLLEDIARPVVCSVPRASVVETLERAGALAD